MYNTISLYLSPWIEIYYLCKQIDVLFHKIHFILPSVAVYVYIQMALLPTVIIDSRDQQVDSRLKLNIARVHKHT